MVKNPGSELARVLLADSLQGANWPGSKKAVNPAGGTASRSVKLSVTVKPITVEPCCLALIKPHIISYNAKNGVRMPVYKMRNISHRSFTFYTLSFLHFRTFAFYNFPNINLNTCFNISNDTTKGYS